MSAGRARLPVINLGFAHIIGGISTMYRLPLTSKVMNVLTRYELSKFRPRRSYHDRRPPARYKAVVWCGVPEQYDRILGGSRPIHSFIRSGLWVRFPSIAKRFLPPNIGIPPYRGTLTACVLKGIPGIVHCRTARLIQPNNGNQQKQRGEEGKGL